MSLIVVYHLLLGGNEGDIDATMRLTLNALGEFGTVTKSSRIFQSPPWGFQCDAMFHNMAVAFDTKLHPHELLASIKKIEISLGRDIHNNCSGYTSRPIDIDIIFAGNIILFSPTLQIPHPRLHLRRFVLMPLADIAPRFVNPQLSKTVKQLLDDCPDNSEVVPVSVL